MEIHQVSNFKLLLFAFDKGPLSRTPSDTGSSISLGLFISIACLPIRIKNNKQKPSHGNHDTQINKPKSHSYYATQALVLAVLLRVYAYKEYLHPNFIILLYASHVYFGLEIITAVVSASLPRFFPELELEPQFNDPYFSTSLQDYWGRRWNLMVTNILRATVYDPVRLICTRIFGRTVSLAMGVLATFVVSGLMHELLFFYIGRVWPTWEALCFFIFQGICVGAEIRVKKLLKGRFELPRLVSRLLTISFVVAAGVFFPRGKGYIINGYY
ncbi:hypothetical protein MKX01_038693 [Papaver californicum]|nr:hypothetical protein MKX01_038693 [Papaver californicum]